MTNTPEYNRAWRLANPERNKANRRRSRAKCREQRAEYQREYRMTTPGKYIEQTYGLTPKQHDDMLWAQEWRCALCLKELLGITHIDHNHVTGEVRGILCHNCNVGLGHFRDDPKLLDMAIQYLRSRDVKIG